uniref:Ribosome biogenesis protein BOP1 homolog n=1 Tax=Lutzomyia longipalpis TaxID=7200 RepID=A0A7G3AYA7_LUTLO
MPPLKNKFKRHFEELSLGNSRGNDEEKPEDEIPDEIRVAEESESEEEGEENNSSSDDESVLSFADMDGGESSQDDTESPGEEEEGTSEEEESDEEEEKVVKDEEKQAAPQVDEYQEDTSDEEDIRNTVGNIPMHWYDEYKHIGYNWDAEKIGKPIKGDQLDDFLKRMEDPDFWKTVKDPQTGQNIILSDEDIDLIKKIAQQRIPDGEFDEFAPWVDWFTSEVEKMPIRNIPEHKRSFLPSRTEKKKISRYVHALKMGWMKTREEREREAAEQQKGPKFYMLWESDTTKENMRRIHDHVTAPKRPLPGHAESYNPPPEYLFDKKEMREWKRQEQEPHKRKLHFVPQKFKSLREVPAYARYVHERFLRCLDLYLCPRANRMKLTIEPEYLIPKLPSPRDLQPFPTHETLIYVGHSDIVRTMSVEPQGEFIVTGSDDTSIKIWEVCTARCIKTIQMKDIVRYVAWCPNSKLSLIAVASGQRLLLVNPETGDKLIVAKTDELLAEAPESDLLDQDRLKTAVQWTEPEGFEHKTGIRVIINHFKQIKQVTWHGRGDYLATVMPDGAHRSVIIHQLSKRRSQFPFSKSKGLVECVIFHPVKPLLFVATQKSIRMYDLVKQELVKKLMSNSNWISDIAVHPKGDNLIVSTYDKKILWFDLDLSTKPYQTMRLHKGAVRGVAFHRNRRSQFPFSKSKGLVECVIFHPVKPLLFVATQKSIRMYDLVKQELVKKLMSNSNWISDIAVHPKGDNLIVSTYDKKILWFDLDLSTKPYQTMRLHKGAVRGVAFHRKYPLFASGSDDASVIVDLLQNPLIVPLKKLETHEKVNDFGVFSVVWHPSQPWVFSTGGDKTIRLYT